MANHKDSNITRLAATTTMTPRQAIAHALERCEEEGISDVLLVGYYENGEFFTFSSRMTRRDGLWFAELLRDWALHGGNDGE